MGKKKGASKNVGKVAPAFDIWNQTESATGKAKAITEAQPVNIDTTGTKKWDVSVDTGLHLIEGKARGEVRKRKIMYVKPNNVPAVELPHAGQSYVPQVDEHQEAMAKAVHKLEKQQASHEKFAQWLSIGKSKEEKALYGGGRTDFGVQPDYLGPKRKAVVEGDEVPTNAAGDDSEDDEAESGAATKNVTKKRRSEVKKKHTTKSNIKMVHRRDVKRTRDERRHPDRDSILDEFDDLPELVAGVQKDQLRKFNRMARRKLQVADGLMTKKIGRHIHHPLPLEVQTTGQLVGSLRHVKSGEVHPLEHRVKSLEARNLIPARMRHTYCKNKKPKSKGEVMIRREPFGILPDASDRH